MRFWSHYETARILIDLFQNRIMFCKYPGPLWSHRNGFVFKICIWISVFRRKKRFENPILGCWDICEINTVPFFLKHPVYTVEMPNSNLPNSNMPNSNLPTSNLPNSNLPNSNLIHLLLYSLIWEIQFCKFNFKNWILEIAVIYCTILIP